MASAGGSWIKITSGALQGQMLFVMPNQSPGQALVAKAGKVGVNVAKYDVLAANEALDAKPSKSTPGQNTAATPQASPKLSPLVPVSSQASVPKESQIARQAFLKKSPQYEETLKKKFKFDTGPKTRLEFIENDTDALGNRSAAWKFDSKGYFVKHNAQGKLVDSIKLTIAEIKYYNFLRDGKANDLFNVDAFLAKGKANFEKLKQQQLVLGTK